MRLLRAETYWVGLLAFAYVRKELAIDPDELKSKRRHAPLVRARALFTWIMRNHTGAPPASYPTIGELLGGRDHATIINSANTAAILRDYDPAFATLCARFADFLAESAEPQGAVQ